MAEHAKPDLANLLTEKVHYGRSSMQKWVWENYDQIIKAMPDRRNWLVLTEAATEARVTDAEGKKPNPNSMRATFNRVKRIKDEIGTPSGQPRLNASADPSATQAAPVQAEHVGRLIEPDMPKPALRRTFAVSTPKKEI